MKAFELPYRVTEVTEEENNYRLVIDGSIFQTDIKRFETEFNCSLTAIFPYKRASGGNHLSLDFLKN